MGFAHLNKGSGHGDRSPAAGRAAGKHGAAPVPMWGAHARADGRSSPSVEGLQIPAKRLGVPSAGSEGPRKA